MNKYFNKSKKIFQLPYPYYLLQLYPLLASPWMASDCHQRSQDERQFVKAHEACKMVNEALKEDLNSVVLLIVKNVKKE